MTPDTAAIIAEALRRASVDIHQILDGQEVSAERLSETSIALGEALRAIGSSGAEALQAAGLIGGPTESEICGTSFMAGSICTLWPNHHGGHQQRCPYCGVDENAEDHRTGCPNYPEPEDNSD